MFKDLVFIFEKDHLRGLALESIVRHLGFSVYNAVELEDALFRLPELTPPIVLISWEYVSLPLMQEKLKNLAEAQKKFHLHLSYHPSDINSHDFNGLPLEFKILEIDPINLSKKFLKLWS